MVSLLISASNSITNVTIITRISKSAQRELRIHFKSKGNIKNIRQNRLDTLQHQYPVDPVNPVKIPCFMKWIQS